jgi:hypothetical protein
MARYQLTQADRAKGGRNAPREAKVKGGKKGFEVTCERHPFFARHWLKYCPGMKRANGTIPIKQEEEA